MFRKRKNTKVSIPETDAGRIGRIAHTMYANRFRERTGNKTVTWQDIRFALLSKRHFIIADGKKYDLLNVLPEMYR